MYGRTDEQWEQLRESAEYHLVKVAKTHGLTDYSTLNQVIAEENDLPPFDFFQQPGRDAIAKLLVEISEKTYAEHGILLTALVMHKGSSHLGGGFYKLAARLGRIPANPTAKQKDEALSQLISEVHEFYARPKSAP